MGGLHNTLPAATPNVHWLAVKLAAGACNPVVDNDTMAHGDFHTIGSDNFDASDTVPFTLSLRDAKQRQPNALVTFRAR